MRILGTHTIKPLTWTVSNVHVYSEALSYSRRYRAVQGYNPTRPLDYTLYALRSVLQNTSRWPSEGY